MQASCHQPGRELREFDQGGTALTPLQLDAITLLQLGNVADDVRDGRLGQATVLGAQFRLLLRLRCCQVFIALVLEARLVIQLLLALERPLRLELLLLDDFGILRLELDGCDPEA